VQKAVTFFLIIFFSLVIVPQAHAIILLPALILIPIAKIVAVIFAGLALPSLGLSYVTHRLFKTPIQKAVTIAVLLLTVTCVLAAIFLKVFDPSRPFI
jgi:hypothetical protein